MKKWLVVYRVKLSELWCANECKWMEYSAVVKAKTKRGAQLAFRESHEDRPRFIIGQHVSTRKAR